MDAVTYPDPVVRSELGRWIEQRVDVSRSAEVARVFGVPAVPTAVAVAADGRILARLGGFVEPEAFARWLKTTEREGR